MRIVSPSIEIMRTGLETEFVTPEQFIEKVGRTCYKSEDKITEDSATKFVGNLIKRGHEAMIEHWSLIFKVNTVAYDRIVRDWEVLLHGRNREIGEPLRPHIRFTDYDTPEGESRYIVSGNMRAWRDYTRAFLCNYGRLPAYLCGIVRNYPLFFPEYQDHVPTFIANDIMIPISVSDLTDVEKRVHQDVTVKFICDRGVSHEIVRHRVASFAQESTRYCNYGLDKFDNCITVVEPLFIEDAYNANRPDIINAWERACSAAEFDYFNLLSYGCTPQEARSVLPSSLKTEIIVTMNIDGWNHFFELRDAVSAQPDMQHIAHMAKCRFEVNDIWKFEA